MSLAIKAHFDGKVFVPDEPVDLPVGEPAVIRIGSILQPADGTGMTGQDLAESEFSGLWKDRTDIGDTSEFVRRLRRDIEQRRR